MMLNNTNNNNINTCCDTPAPVSNVWQLRMEVAEKKKSLEQELREVEEAQRKLEQAKKLQEAEAKKLAPQGGSKKKRPFKKHSKKPAQPQEEKVEEVSEEIQEEPEDFSGFVEVESKKQQPRPQMNPKLKALKAKALHEAFDQMVTYCADCLTAKKAEEISTNLQFMNNYSGIITIDISDDVFPVEEGGETFTFSKLQFLENRTFQYKVIEQLSKRVPTAWISFFPSRKGGAYCAKFTLKRQ